MIFKSSPEEKNENESFVRKARCMKSNQVLLLCAAKFISIILNMSVCMACFQGVFVGIDDRWES